MYVNDDVTHLLEHVLSVLVMTWDDMHVRVHVHVHACGIPVVVMVPVSVM